MRGYKNDVCEPDPEEKIDGIILKPRHWFYIIVIVCSSDTFQELVKVYEIFMDGCNRV